MFFQNIPNPNTTTTTTGMPQNRISPANNSLQRLGSGRSWSLLCSGSQESSGHIANAIRVLDSRTRPLLVFSRNLNKPSRSPNSKQGGNDKCEPAVPDSAGPKLPICCLKVAGVRCFFFSPWCLLYVFSKHTKPKYNDNHYWHATKQRPNTAKLGPNATNITS